MYTMNHKIAKCFTRNLTTLSKSVLKDIEPISLVKKDLVTVFSDIRQALSHRPVLKDISTYYFDGNGKAVRPMLSLLMSKAVNFHTCGCDQLTHSQKEVSKIAEMIHVSSLLHDDVIDCSDQRRGKPTVHSQYSHKQAIFGGDFILSVASNMLSKLKNDDVVIILSQVLVDLVEGEFMQLSSKNEEEFFNHYVKKTFNKTASLIARSCKAVALLGGGDEVVQNAAYEYGKNCGLAFQFVDDVLDFTPSNTLGKPNFGDLKAGIVTAPVIFASKKYPEINEMMERQFQEPDDIKRTVEFIYKSGGLEQTKALAQEHCNKAVMHLSALKDSPEKTALNLLTSDIINRKK